MIIIIRGILFFSTLYILCLQALPVQSATYYISPTGSDSNPGTSEKPWLTFAFAISSSRASCGDTLVLKDGTYGDGTRTGKISITSMTCSAADEFTLTAENQRQAKIFDKGTGKAVSITKSAYIVVDGLYAQSMDNIGAKDSSSGTPFYTNYNNNITLKNLVSRNPNRYANSHAIAVEYSNQVLLEDNEAYTFHRHCVEVWRSSNIVVRRQYCNPRGGRIPGGFTAVNSPVGSADSVVAFYPCENCVAENVIADGTTNGMYLVGAIASGGKGMFMRNSKVLGSICYKCGFGNGINIHSQNSNTLVHTTQNMTIRDVAFIDFNSVSAAIKSQDAINTVVDHVTVLGGRTDATGILASDSKFGGSPAVNSIIMTNIVVSGLRGPGFAISGYNTWSGDRVVSNANGIAFSPSLPANWTNISTAAPGMGTCKAWIPDGSPLKGSGTNGSDIGANILYRYISGVLTSMPLWDPRTGEFPHGAPDLDGTNRVAGESLFDIHKRLNVNTRECPFPKDYGNGDSDLKRPISPVGLRVS